MVCLKNFLYILLVMLLFSNGLQPNYTETVKFSFTSFTKQHGKTALHLAAENGHEQVADMLLYHKAFVNAKSKHGLTPLHLAAANGNVAFIKLLIEKHGATIDALTLVSKMY